MATIYSLCFYLHLNFIYYVHCEDHIYSSFGCIVNWFVFNVLLWKLSSYRANTSSKYILNISCILREYKGIEGETREPNTDSHGNLHIEERRQRTNKQCVHCTMVVIDMHCEEKEQIKDSSIKGEK